MPDTASTSTFSLSAKQEKLIKQMCSWLPWQMFTVLKLPTLRWWRIRVKALDAEKCEVTMPFRRSTQNPFNSVYFAAQCGAAELSTGGLAMLHMADLPKTSMLVTSVESKYYKKASDNLRFVCEDGHQIHAALKEAMDTGEGVQVVAKSSAYLPTGVLASEFWITWSFKRK